MSRRDRDPTLDREDIALGVFFLVLIAVAVVIGIALDAPLGGVLGALALAVAASGVLTRDRSD